MIIEHDESEIPRFNLRETWHTWMKAAEHRREARARANLPARPTTYADYVRMFGRLPGNVPIYMKHVHFRERVYAEMAKAIETGIKPDWAPFGGDETKTYF